MEMESKTITITERTHTGGKTTAINHTLRYRHLVYAKTAITITTSAYVPALQTLQWSHGVRDRTLSLRR